MKRSWFQLSSNVQGNKFVFLFGYIPWLKALSVFFFNFNKYKFINFFMFLCFIRLIQWK